MRLTWSAFALSDRDEIFTFIELENPAAAILVDERIVVAVRRPIDFPASGRVGRIAGTRELVISGTLTSQRTQARKPRFEYCASCTGSGMSLKLFQSVSPV